MANLDSSTDIGCTPLHYGAFKNSPDVAQLLIKHGAEVDARSENGNTPLSFAASKKSCEVTQLLMGQGANTNGIDLSWMDD